MKNSLRVIVPALALAALGGCVVSGPLARAVPAAF